MNQKENDSPQQSVPREQKRVLGRGLSALLSGSPRTENQATDGETAAFTDLLIEIPLLNIALNPFQPRESFAPEQLAELADSIKQHGVLQPVVVRAKGRNSYELVAGERRFRAATAAGLKQIPAIVKEMDDRTSLAVALIENIQRQELNPVESARAYQRLMTEFELNQTELAREVGKSQPSIANSLRLLALPEPILESLSCGSVTEGHAKVLLSIDGADSKISLWKQVVKESLSVRETERRASALKNIPRGISSTTNMEHVPNAEQVKLEEGLSLALGTKVRLRFSGKEKGNIEVQFYSLEQLDGLLQRLGK